ncbi:hypothetical protein CLOP_g25083 [Closterium sp. NIES-67]|nr:hypothetical protein CLOP_g25083 [Closterium sp. NIES-67]
MRGGVDGPRFGILDGHGLSEGHMAGGGGRDVGFLPRVGAGSSREEDGKAGAETGTWRRIGLWRGRERGRSCGRGSGGRGGSAAGRSWGAGTGGAGWREGKERRDRGVEEEERGKTGIVTGRGRGRERKAKGEKLSGGFEKAATTAEGMARGGRRRQGGCSPRSGVR